MLTMASRKEEVEAPAIDIERDFPKLGEAKSLARHVPKKILSESGKPESVTGKKSKRPILLNISPLLEVGTFKRIVIVFQTFWNIAPCLIAVG